MAASVLLKIELLGIPAIRAVLFAAVELLTEVEDADEVLIPDAVAERASELRQALASLRRTS